MYFELTPAYGRDYKTKAEVTAAFNAGRDFLGDYQMGFRPCNKADIPAGSKVVLRYKRNTAAAVITIK